MAVTMPDGERGDGQWVDGRFRFVRRLDVRFRDLDTQGHVNHVVYLSYVEQVRTEYFRDVLLIDIPAGLTWVIARVWCEYLQPLVFGDRVEVGWRIGRLGGASAEYEFELARAGEIVARGGGVLVSATPGGGRSAPIPEAWRARVAQFEGIAPRAAAPSS
jgi:acyl-CoA thioester hydrolase